MSGNSLRLRSVLVVAGLVAASVSVAVSPAAAADAVVTTETGQALEVAGSLVADAAPLVDVGDSFVSAAAGSEVELPADPAEPLVLDGAGGAISVELPVVRGADDGVVDTSGAVVYESGASPVSLAAQATVDGGLQVLVAIDGPDAPTEYHFDMTLPAGATLRATPDGGALVFDANGLVMTSVAPGWALDASGRALPTLYRIEGTTIVQVIDHRDAVYPVVGDPTFGSGCGSPSSRRMTKAQAINTINCLRNFAGGVIGLDVYQFESWYGPLRLPDGAPKLSDGYFNMTQDGCSGPPVLGSSSLPGYMTKACWRHDFLWRNWWFLQAALVRNDLVERNAAERFANGVFSTDLKAICRNVEWWAAVGCGQFGMTAVAAVSQAKASRPPSWISDLFVAAGIRLNVN